MSPGLRLRRARTLNGIKSREALAELTQKNGVFINSQRIGRIERDETDPSIPEIQTLCRTLDMSADWWLMDDHAPEEVILKRLKYMPMKQRQSVINFIDLLRHTY